MSEDHFADMLTAAREQAGLDAKNPPPDAQPAHDDLRARALAASHRLDASSRHLRVIGDALRLWDDRSRVPPDVAESIRVAHDALLATVRVLDAHAEARAVADRQRFAHRTELLVNLASGATGAPAGFVSVDGLPPADVTTSLLRRLPFADGSVAAAYCSHFVEHLYLEEARTFLAEVFATLQPGGTLRVVVPDVGLLLRAYVEGDEHVLRALDEMLRRDGPGNGGGPDNGGGPGDGGRQNGAAGASMVRPVLHALLNYAGGEQDLPQYGSGGDQHRLGFDAPELTRLLEGAGFVEVRMAAHGVSRDARLGQCDRYSTTASTTVAAGPRRGVHLSLFVEASKPPREEPAATTTTTALADGGGAPTTTTAAAATFDSSPPTAYRTDEICELGWDLDHPNWGAALDTMGGALDDASTDPATYPAESRPGWPARGAPLPAVRADVTSQLAALPIVDAAEVARIEALQARMLPFALRGMAAATRLAETWVDASHLATMLPHARGHVIAHCGSWHGHIDSNMWAAHCNGSRSVPRACDPSPSPSPAAAAAEGLCTPPVPSEAAHFERLAIRDGVTLSQLMAAKEAGAIGHERVDADIRWSWEATLNATGAAGAALAALDAVEPSIPGRRITASRGDPDRRRAADNIATGEWVVRVGWGAYERSIHFDTANNWMLDVAPRTPSHRQRKRVILGHPWQSGALQFHFGEASGRFRHSDLDPATPSAEPALAHVTALQHVMARGDLLFIPAFWWHHVLVDEPGEWLSLNLFQGERSAAGATLHPCPDKVRG